MRSSLFICLFIILLSISCLGSISVHNQCQDRESTLLLQLKKSLKFTSSNSSKLGSWNEGTTDCCKWGGVICDNEGHVIDLDLNDESISAGIDNSSSLFRLHYLRRLNLAHNDFKGSQIPSGFHKLTNLTYLNMTLSSFAGQIPIEISRMTRLVTLDLSYNYELFVENPSLMVLFHNLTELRELYLDGVNISAHRYEWSLALSSLTNLQVLGLSFCSLSGPIDSSLENLQSLSVIRLNYNNFSAPFPKFFADFSNLTSLELYSCGFYGVVPERIFQIPTLMVLDLASNDLQGFFPDSVLKLAQIVYLDLSNNRFTGPIPSLDMSKNLTYICLAVNRFTGPIPSFRMSEGLTDINLSSNNLTGTIPSSHFDGLVNLTSIDLSENSVGGTIPSSLFSIQSLSEILLQQNQFEGQLPEFTNASSSLLGLLDLSNNKLGGLIPMSIFELGSLGGLLLSSNNFSGTMKFEIFQKLGNLGVLDLAYNSLTIDASGGNFYFPNLSSLNLASCKLQKFPNLKNQSNMAVLDLSNNQISGQIPNWIWKIGSSGYFYMNLSHNLLDNLQKPYNFSQAYLDLDLHSNQLHGQIPIPPQASYLDYSSNNFNDSIPADIGNYIADVEWFFLSNNNINGVIPESMCNGSSLEVLDFSNNNLRGTIPSCLIEQTSETLQVLSLKGNNLHGNILGTFPINCQLETLDLNGNNFGGRVPKSLANCRGLQLLNLGNNKINDTFPCWLKNSSSLRVLVLRSNKFHGDIGCLEANISLPVLQIIDIASNNFRGNLPPGCFLNWRAMMVNKDEEPPLLSNVDVSNGRYYQNTVSVSIKGQDRELVKILTIFTTIDFSENEFQGEMAKEVGDLRMLYLLNLSHNALKGPIPPTIGNLKQLGSLDLSYNMLSGEIPTQLASLTFLSFLNLSYNQLVGMIPRGPQFGTFTQTSFEANKGLCGEPLNTSCDNTTVAGLPPGPPPTFGDKHSHPETGIDWDWFSAELGFITGFGCIIWPLLFCKRWRLWYYKHVEQILWRILGGRVNLGRKAYRNPIRRL